MNGFFEGRTIEMMVMGMAVRDVILIVLVLAAIGLWVYTVTHNATNPMNEISKAMRKIADGDYDVNLITGEDGKEFKQLEQDFNAMVTQLKNNEYLHKDFSSNISHEFKTPLSIIKGYADLLQSDELSDAERKLYAGMIAQESKRLTSLTSNMLKLSSLDYNETHMKKSRFYLDEQIRQVVLSMESSWAKKNIMMDLELSPIEFTGEEELINQVWMNLLDNAIKFTPEGGKITIVASATKEQITVTVEDDGIGMSEETLEHIFEQFYRGDTENRYEGSGLGLSLVHRIVNLHGGTVLAESVQGSGSIFMVNLPIQQ
jgi:signal transduction histidine kinase